MELSSSDHGVTHLGIIMDGNRRWAKERGLPTFQGHYEGYKQLIDIVKHTKVRGIGILTVFAFSTENWKRTSDEVKYLLDLFLESIQEQTQDLIDEKVGVRFIGDLEMFSPMLRKEMEDLMEKTKEFKDFTFNIAVGYGGRGEILHALRLISQKGIDVTTLTEEEFSHYLYTAGIPDPDMIIRTSGEQRLSNFLTWQNVYSELYFTDVHWPDFTPAQLDRALEDFSQRQRRFGN